MLELHVKLGQSLLLEQAHAAVICVSAPGTCKPYCLESSEFCMCRVFGWTPKNEINNGRWVMFGFAVGLLTEYATGVDFIQQLKLMVSYLGIADIYD